MKLFTEKLHLNKNTKTSEITDLSSFKEALKETIEKLDDKTYKNYVKHEKEYFENPLSYGNYNSIKTAILSYNGGFYNSYQTSALDDLIKIVKYEYTISDEFNDFLKNNHLFNEIFKFCYKIIKQL